MAKPACIYEFGPFRLDTGAHRLLKENTPVSLQPKSFDLLKILIENQGQAMSKSELLQALWPDTNVEEGNLAFQISVLRKALGPEAGPWIETVPRHGYRLSAPVVVHADSTIQAEAPSRRASAFFTRAALAIAALALTGAFIFLLSPNPTTQPAVRAVPLTSFRGIEAHPALSLDGNRVAFTWNGEKQDNFDIYVIEIASRAVSRLTVDPAEDVSPAWSPDGRTIAFLRRLGHDGVGELRLVPAAGGPEHKVHEIRNLELRHSVGRLLSLSWSPDGSWIAASHREHGELSEGIYLFSRTGEMRRLTSGTSYAGDHMPAFSADGRALAFSRHSGATASEIYVLPIDRTFRPAGEARRATAGKHWSKNPLWTRDGRSILYLTPGGAAPNFQLRITDLTGLQSADRIAPLNDHPWEISAGRHLVYSHQKLDTNIWRARLPPAGKPPVEGEPLISSTRFDHIPRYSPDGKKIAFISDRSGSGEIWLANADGLNRVQMTFFGGPLVGVMNWSPDGQWLVFHARPEGQADLFVIPAAGGPPRRLTTHGADETLASYSRDGRWIYFSGARSGTIQIWKMPAESGEAIQLTKRRGSEPHDSADGKTVFYRLQDASEIWSVRADGGEAVKVTGPIQRFPVGFAVTADGIYYPAPPHDGELRFIRFFSFVTRQSTPIVLARHPTSLGISVSPDSRYILYDQIDESDSDLMLVENFRPQ